jgi:AcrR family transcriptional regulator
MARVTQEHVDARRRQIIEAAARQFGAKGLEPGAATIDDIAADAGLSKGSIYSYFKNKEELLAAIADAGVESDLSTFGRARDRSRSSWDAFWDVARQVWETLMNPANKERVMLTFERMLVDARSGTADRRYVDVPLNALTDLLAGAQVEGRIAPDIDPRVLATALWNCQQGTRAYVLRTGDAETAAAVLHLLQDLVARTAGTQPSGG